MLTAADIAHRFTYHAPAPAQVLKYNEIREQALALALRLNVLVPQGRELSSALTKLEESVMHANAGIAREMDAAVSPSLISVPPEPEEAADPPSWQEAEENREKEGDPASADTVVEPVPVGPPKA